MATLLHCFLSASVGAVSKAMGSSFYKNNEDQHRLLSTFVGAISKAMGSSFYKNNEDQAKVQKIPGAIVDWRLMGAVTPVKSQNMCGSCWAYAAVGAVESLNYILTGELIELSAQELIDCDKRSRGCCTGSVTTAFQYITQRGIRSSADYPDRGGFGGPCKSRKKGDKLIFINGYRQIPLYSKHDLLEAISKQSVTVSVDSHSHDFQEYEGGIYRGPASFVNLNHTMLAVGYGAEDGEEFLILKNSWGTGWGIDGYMTLKIDDKWTPGLFGVKMECYYPIKNIDWVR